MGKKSGGAMTMKTPDPKPTPVSSTDAEIELARRETQKAEKKHFNRSNTILSMDVSGSSGKKSILGG